MFLRKIVQHLRTQNWTAVGIDLLAGFAAGGLPFPFPLPA